MKLYGFWIVGFVFLIARIGSFFLALPELREGQIATIRGQITSEPSVDYGLTKFNLGNYRVSGRLKEEWHYGEAVNIRGQMKCFDAFRCLHGTLNVETIELVEKARLNLLEETARKTRQTMKAVYFGSLKNEEANLLSGVVLGNLDLNRQFKDKLAAVGLTHIVAASGMNLTLLAGGLWSMLRSLRWSLKKRTLLLIALIIFYTAIAGWQPAIVRAALMTIAVFISPIVGRKKEALYSLGASAYIMLWVNPALLFDFGFLLSFASLLGQIVLITDSVSVTNWRESLKLLVHQNIAAIAFTFPIVLIGFGKFSLLSTVSTLLVTWTVEPLMIVGLVAGIIGNFLPGLAKVMLIPAGVMAQYFLEIVHLLSQVNLVVKMETGHWLLALGYYMLAFALVGTFKSGSSRKRDVE